MNKIIFSCVFLLGACWLGAQNDVQYTHYLFNKFAYNPAYAGSAGTPVVNAIYRSQWLGLEKAPETGTANFHMPIQCGRAGIGFGFTADQAAIFNSNRINGAYSYKIKTGAKSTLSLGLGAQMEFGRADYTRTNPADLGDQVILNGNDEFVNNKFNVGAGLYFEQDNRFYIGLSVPQLINTSFFNEVNIAGDGEDYHTYYLMTGFVTDLSSSVKLMPGAMISYNSNAPFEFDINANLIFMDKLWVGLNYRLDDSLDGLLQYQIGDNLRAGFAYDFTTSELQNHSNGTVEFMLNYSFNQFSKEISNLRYF